MTATDRSTVYIVLSRIPTRRNDLHYTEIPMGSWNNVSFQKKPTNNAFKEKRFCVRESSLGMSFCVFSCMHLFSVILYLSELFIFSKCRQPVSVRYLGSSCSLSLNLLTKFFDCSFACFFPCFIYLSLLTDQAQLPWSMPCFACSLTEETVKIYVLILCLYFIDALLQKSLYCRNVLILLLSIMF